MAHDVFLSYFSDTKEYPLTQFPEEILPLGELWEYVPSTFINGFLNIKQDFKDALVSAYLLSRYEKRGEEMGQPETITLYSKLKVSSKFRITQKQQVIDLFNMNFTSDGNLSVFQDDLFLLYKLNDVYMFIWCDNDVSDCCIGRFKTENSHEQVLQNFRDQANLLSNEHQGEDATPLPLSWLSGWRSF